MTTQTRPRSEETQHVIDWICDLAFKGVYPLSGASDLAGEYLIDRSYAHHDIRADQLVRDETAAHFTTGFLCGLGGTLKPPGPVCPQLAAAAIVQARMAAAVAVVYGQPLDDPRVRGLVLLSLTGNSAPRLAMDARGLAHAQPLEQMLSTLSDRQLDHIVSHVATRLMGRHGSLQDVDQITIAGTGIDELVDASACYLVGRTAINIFRHYGAEIPTGTAGARLAYWEAPS